MLLVYMGLAVLIYMQFGAGTDLRKNRNVCIVIGFFLFIISAMKAIPAFGDLVIYSRSFERTKTWTYKMIWDAWQEGTIKDGFFYIVAKVFSDIGFSDYGWMAAISLFFGAAMGWFIYCNSAKPVLSLMLLMTLEYYRFTFSGLRQVICLSIIFMFSYGYILDRRPLKFIISVFAASLFHSTALVFLPAYLVASWKMGWKQIALIFVTLVFYFLFPGAGRWLIQQIAWTDQIAAYAVRSKGLTWGGVAIHACILAFCFLFRNETSLPPYLHWRRVDAFLNCMIIGFCLQILATMIAEAFRMAYYYNMCCIAVVSNVVAENKRESNHSTMYLVISLCLVAYLLWSRAYFDMIYFWQV